MNSNSIKELVDVNLYYSILNLFEEIDNAPRWMISNSDIQIDYSLTVNKFSKIAMNTDDFRQVHAIALYLWFSKTQYSDFLLRALKILQGSFDVILESYVFNCSVLNESQKELFKDMLCKGEPKSVLEVCIALFALDDKINDIICQRMLSFAAIKIRDEGLDIVSEVGVYYGLSKFKKRAGACCPELIQALDSMTRTILKPKSHLVGICEYYELRYSDVIILTFLFQKFEKITNLNCSKVENLKNQAFDFLCLERKEWSLERKMLVKTLVNNKHKPYIVNAKNLRWCIDQGLSKYFFTKINYAGVSEELIDVQVQTAAQVLSDDFVNMDEAQLMYNARKYPEVVHLLFSQYYAEFTDIYRILLESGEFDLEKYTLYYAAYLSDFKDKRSIELLKKVLKDRSSFEYQLLMQRCLIHSDNLNKRDNVLLKKETETYVYLYFPDRYEDIIGGGTNE